MAARFAPVAPADADRIYRVQMALHSLASSVASAPVSLDEGVDLDGAGGSVRVQVLRVARLRGGQGVEEGYVKADILVSVIRRDASLLDPALTERALIALEAMLCVSMLSIVNPDIDAIVEENTRVDPPSQVDIARGGPNGDEVHASITLSYSLHLAMSVLTGDA